MATIKTGDGFTGTLNYALDLNKRNNKEVRFLAVEGVRRRCGPAIYLWEKGDV